MLHHMMSLCCHNKTISPLSTEEARSGLYRLGSGDGKAYTPGTLELAGHSFLLAVKEKRAPYEPF